MSIQLIQNYYTKVEQMIRYGGTRNESSLRKPFQDLLEGYARSKNLVLVAEVELTTKKGTRIRPDGVLKDALRQDWGFWESKDEKDKIEDEIKAKWKVPTFLGEVTGVEALKRYYFDPTCTICGLTSGWQGKGTKTVLPAEASAKIDFRLVPNLSAEIVVDLLRKHFDKHGFTDVEIVSYDGYRPEMTDVTAPIVKAAAQAAQKIYGQEPVLFPTAAGSGPMWSLSSFIGGVPVICAGISHPDSRIHSPNENSILQNYYDGMRYIGAFISEFAV